jgi:ribosomal protein S12 methylthiotransferase
MAYPLRNKNKNLKTGTTGDLKTQRLSEGKNVGLINLGCARNLVDSQVILGQLKRQGHRVVDIQQSDIAIVNTCAFIEDAKKESIDTIVDLLELKKQGKLKKVIVAGCLAQRYAKELAKEFKDIDAIIGAQKLDQDFLPAQVSLTPQHFAYVKICESCYNRCSFCIIPKLKGKFVSRRVESVLEEIKQLDQKGVKEINLIGQDITAYGMDIYHEMSLARLLKEMVKVTKNIQWIRLLYAFPAHVTDELIETIANEPKICKYIDMPLQHISDHLLKSMNRNITTAQTKELIHKIRQKMPSATLRTTFIVGMPGETEKDFEELKAYVQETRFEKLGVFVYSQEEGTKACDMPGQVPEKVKRARMEELMNLQQGISKEIQQKWLGQEQIVLIDEEVKEEKGVYLGRMEYDAPEVDGVVYVHSAKTLKNGDLVKVKITDSLEYDLVGELV